MVLYYLLIFRFIRESESFIYPYLRSRLKLFPPKDCSTVSIDCYYLRITFLKRAFGMKSKSSLEALYECCSHLVMNKFCWLFRRSQKGVIGLLEMWPENTKPAHECCWSRALPLANHVSDVVGKKTPFQKQNVCKLHPKLSHDDLANATHALVTTRPDNCNFLWFSSELFYCREQT